MLRHVGDLIHQRSPAFEITKAAVLALSDGERILLGAWMAKYIAVDGSVLRPSLSPTSPTNTPNTPTRERRGFPKRRPTSGSSS